MFIFLDPPYLSAEASKLYGKSGDLHTGFNHGLLAAELRNCSHDWLMTIDNSPGILDLYYWANIYPWEKLYSMTNADGRKSKGGKELLVASFKIATFDYAWQVAQRQRINKQRNTNAIQGELFLEMSERQCYLKGIADTDAEKIISEYGYNHTYLIIISRVDRKAH